MKLYQQIAEEIAERIERGFYRCNEKLPSIRQLSKDHQVSISTVQEAYRRLEDMGLATARPKSGYYVSDRQKVSQLPQTSEPSQSPMRVTQWEQVLNLLCAQEDESTITLSRAVPDIDAASLKPLGKIMADLARSQSDFLTYQNLRGNEQLRHQIARLAIDSGCQLNPEDIITTTGCQEALAISLRTICQPGDIVAVDSPSFYGSMQAFKGLELKALEIPTHAETGISLEALELALEQWPIKALQVTPTNNNPLGYSMPDSHKQRLIQLANRHDITIIEDDVFGDLAYHYPRPRTIKSFDTQDRVMLCSAFSKTLAPGLRVGWVAPGARCAEQAMHLKYISSGYTAGLPQMAIAEFIAQGGYERHLRKMRQQYQANRNVFINWLEKYFPEGTRISYPQGSFVVWVELPFDIDTAVLNERTLSRGVSIAPGMLFSASDKYRHCLRLNYTNSSPAIEAAIQTIADEITKMRNEA